MTNSRPVEILEVLKVLSEVQQVVGQNKVAIMLIAKEIGVNPFELMAKAKALNADDRAFREAFREFGQ